MGAATSTDDLRHLNGIAATTGTLSMIACLYVMVTFFTKLDKAFILCVFGFWSGFFLALGRAFITDSSETDKYNVGGSCKFQGFMVQWWALGGVLWNVVVAWNFYKIVVLKKSMNNVYQKTMKFWLPMVLGFTSLLAFILLGMDEFGDAALWCWIPSKRHDDPDEPNLDQLWFFYLWVIAGWLLSLWVFIAVTGGCCKEKKKMNDDAEAAKKQLKRNLSVYIGVFIFCWFFGLLNRFVGWVSGSYVGLVGLQMFFIPLTGFANAVCYSDVGQEALKRLEKIYESWTGQQAGAGGGLNRLESRASEIKDGDIALLLQTPTPSVDKAIFVSTFNMGEAGFDTEAGSALGEWLPPGYSIYAVGLQECLLLEDVRKTILAHLEAVNKGTTYEVFAREIGSANTTLKYHGFIAITVFVAKAEVESGKVKLQEAVKPAVNQGIDTRILGRASNKGAVGLSLTYYNTSLAFTTAHFASDSGGNRRFKKRNENAIDALHNQCLVPDDVQSSLQFQNHHTFIFGDFNYRLDSTDFNADQILGSVAGAAAEEAKKLGNGWRQSRWNALTTKVGYDPSTDSSPEISEGVWQELLDKDELRRAMGGRTPQYDRSHVFLGFLEQPVAFPPSFRRKRGQEGDCGDYTNLEVLQAAFTTNIDKSIDKEDIDEEEKEYNLSRESKVQSPLTSERDQAQAQEDMEAAEAKKKKKGARPPSYTDRVLWHSMPDQAQHLRPLAYDLCDGMTVSDHRPVAASFRLFVDPDFDREEVQAKVMADEPEAEILAVVCVKPQRDSSSIMSPSEVKAEMHRDLYSGTAYDTSELERESAASIEALGEVKGEAAGGSSKESKVKPVNFERCMVQVIFPIPGEDPNCQARKAGTAADLFLATAAPPVVTTYTGSEFTQNDILKNTFEVPFLTFRERGIEALSDVIPDLGMHALLKILRDDREPMCQGLLCLRPVLQKGGSSTQEVVLSHGGQYMGTIKVDVDVDRARRLPKDTDKAPRPSASDDVSAGMSPPANKPSSPPSPALAVRDDPVPAAAV